MLIFLLIWFQGKKRFSHSIWSICLFLNFDFDLALPFYFLKSNRYFSACKNLPNSSCHFWKHKSVFFKFCINLQSYQTTPLYFFSSNVIYIGRKETIKVNVFETWVLSSKFVKFLMSVLKRQVNFPPNFASLFSVMKDSSAILI